MSSFLVVIDIEDEAVDSHAKAVDLVNAILDGSIASVSALPAGVLVVDNEVNRDPNELHTGVKMNTRKRRD